MSIKLSESDVVFIQQLPVARFATVTKSGAPVTRPVWPVFDGKNVYVASDPGTAKLRHIAKNPKVSIVFDDYDRTNWSNLRGIIIQGIAEVFWKGEEYRYAHALLKEKYPEYRTEEGGWKEGEVAIIKIVPQHVIKWEDGTWSKKQQRSEAIR